MPSRDNRTGIHRNLQNFVYKRGAFSKFFARDRFLGRTCHGHMSRCGYTLIELMVALVVGLIAIGAVYSVYAVQQNSFTEQQSVTEVQQSLRGALAVIEQELRMVGYDPEDAGGFGLVDIRRYDVVKYHNPSIDGQPVLFYTYDKDENGALDRSGRGGRNKEHPKIRISDIHGDGRICLSYDAGDGRRPVADNIEAIAFAYAFDADGDGYCDRWQGSKNLIWAVDSDNDNLLDTHIDTNNDGLINEKDDTNGDQKIDMADGCALDSQITLDKVKAVRVWLLAVTGKPVRAGRGQRTIAVGDRVFAPADDGLKRLVMESRIQLRNL